MLKVHNCAGDGPTALATGTTRPSLPTGAVWIDVLEPDQDDTDYIKRETGLDLPSRAQLSEVENSSRLRNVEDALYLSLPLVRITDKGVARMMPIGFILTHDRLVTIRFDPIPSFDAVEKVLEGGGKGHRSAPGTFVALIEAVVDRLADALEEVGTRVDKVVETVFGNSNVESSSGNKKKQDARLRATLKHVGSERQLVSKIRGTLLGVGRIIPYVQGEGEEWLPDNTKSRLESAAKDIESLDQFEEHLSDKIQFLLDAALGFITIEQNDTFKVLTIASVVGIPPTLIASMYGMNFKHMPELEWVYGYPYGLILIALSAIIPLVYFRRNGWF